GSFTSANSKRLTQLALERNPHSYQVSASSELKSEWFDASVKTVGISAGASTPDEIIQTVIDRVQEIGQITEKETVYE
ncbi:MAG: 4-hydroxy-3-methylbut-2-enyl diphosphate reductase, partial [Fidelibacterota bacterium]